MALIELATNQDVTAIVEAIRSLKQEKHFLTDIIVPLGASLAGALFGALSAYCFQGRSVKHQYHVQRIIELNALAQEIDRLANQLKNVKNTYCDNLSTEPYDRLMASRKPNFNFLPPRFFPDGRMLLNEKILQDKTLTLLAIDHLFGDFNNCFDKWNELSEWHDVVLKENSFDPSTSEDKKYINTLKSLEESYLAPKMLHAEYLYTLTDYLIIESYYYIVAIRQACNRMYKKKAIREAGGLFFTTMRSLKEHKKLLNPVVEVSDPIHPSHHEEKVLARYREKRLPPPTINQMEKDQKIGV